MSLKKKDIIEFLESVYSRKVIKSSTKISTSQRNSLVKKIHFDIIDEFNFKMKKSSINKWKQKTELYESPNKYFQIEIVENRSFYIKTPLVKKFSFRGEGRLQENPFKELLDYLKDSNDWNERIFDDYNLNLLKTLLNYKQKIEDEKESNYNKGELL